MAVVSPETSRVPRAWPVWLASSEFWASLAIVTVWLAVLFDGVFGPSIETHNGVADVGTSTSVPSVAVVAPCAVLATWLLARNVFGRDRG